MKRSTRVLLLLGCVLVVALEGPATLATLAAGWRGPYARLVDSTAAARSATLTPLLAGLALARR